jgi:hypothetical protein
VKRSAVMGVGSEPCRSCKDLECRPDHKLRAYRPEKLGFRAQPDPRGPNDRMISDAAVPF